MKEYKFLIKPLFYIFSLLLSSWIVLYIEEIEHEKIKPIPDAQIEQGFRSDKVFLKKIISDYKNGSIDSTALNEQLERFLDSSNEIYVLQPVNGSPVIEK